MKELCIIKLGGSILTDKKGGRPTLRTRRIKEIAREIAKVRSKNPRLQLVLLHGAGSFGHPLAHQYKLLDSPLSARTLVGVGRTVAAMRGLGNSIAGIFLDAGIPVVPLQTSSFTSIRKGRTQFTDLSIVESIIKKGGVPLFGGDVVLSDMGRTVVASADGLAVTLVKKFKKTQLYFATDTDGVYAVFPPVPREDPLPSLSREEVKGIIHVNQTKASRTDVTGAMGGKLRALLGAHKTTATIFNGNTKGIFAEVLAGKKRGTQIIL